MRDDRQRIDRWLWHARVVRTRTAAAALAEAGKVRVNGQRIDFSSKAVKIGDVLTIGLSATVRVLKIAALSERRGGAEDAQSLYEDLSPPPAPKHSNASADPAGPQREPGSGRPTKRERRALDRVRHRGVDDD